MFSRRMVSTGAQRISLMTGVVAGSAVTPAGVLPRGAGQISSAPNDALAITTAARPIGKPARKTVFMPILFHHRIQLRNRLCPARLLTQSHRHHDVQERPV